MLAVRAVSDTAVASDAVTRALVQLRAIAESAPAVDSLGPQVLVGWPPDVTGPFREPLVLISAPHPAPLVTTKGPFGAPLVQVTGPSR